MPEDDMHSILKKNYREKRYSRPLQLCLKINTRQESNIGKVGSSVLHLKLLILDLVRTLCVLISCQVHDFDFSFPTQSTASTMNKLSVLNILLSQYFCHWSYETDY